MATAAILSPLHPGLRGRFDRKGEKDVMAKNTRKVNKANHGKRPASSKARKAKRRKMGV